MINTIIQPTEKCLFNTPEKNFFNFNATSFIKESSGCFLRAEKADSETILSPKCQFYNADEMAVYKNILFLMYENQEFWI